MKFVLIILFLAGVGSGYGQAKTDSFLQNLIWANASSQLRMVLEHPDSFRYQIIYTRIDRDARGEPHFKNFHLRVDPKEYFNPASTVKMPLAFLALEKINELKPYGVDLNTSMITDSAYPGQSAVSKDSSAENGMPSVAQYIKKIFLVSDNDAYNRLYEFIGPERINRTLWEKSYNEVRITRRFVPMSEDQNRHTNPIRFVKDGKILYEQPAAFNPIDFDFSKKILLGKGHLNAEDSLINQPMDFTKHNNIPLEDLQQILQSVLFPGSVPPFKRFKLGPEDLSFLYQYMSEYPGESRHPKYDTSEYYNSYAKFFLFRAGHAIPPDYVRIFNKPGWSYGFLTDVAYIVDFKNEVEFMLSAVIYTNRDAILNDNKYEYDETGFPYFKELGYILYRYELKRERQFKPNLQAFKFRYN
ncbi:MAG: serine hydrolase [Chitinophagales bacterium]